MGGEEEDRVLEEEEIMAGEEEDRVLEEEEVDELLLELSSGSTPSINQLIRALLGCIFALSCLLLAHWAIYAFPLLQHHLLLPLLFLPPLLIVFPRLRVMPLGDKISQMFGLLSKWLLLRKRGNTTRTKIDRLVSHESRKKKKKKKKQAKKKKQKQRDLSRAGLFRPDLRGMDKYEIEALEYLEHRKSSLLGICGMRGVGKSTLLWLLHTNYADHSSFDYIFHVEAGPGFTVATLQGVLARTIGLDQAPEIAQVNMISSFLRGKTFLVLLDDLHFSIDLAAAGLPMPLGHRQKVIFTTRGQSICAEMGCVSNTIRMECLEEEDAWDLFKYNVGGEIIDYDSEIEDLAKKVQNCLFRIPCYFFCLSFLLLGKLEEPTVILVLWLSSQYL